MLTDPMPMVKTKVKMILLERLVCSPDDRKRETKNDEVEEDVRKARTTA
jgi:hypothetical protein